MRIKLKTISDVHNFVLVCNKYQNAEILVKQGKQIIDGRSILGIFSLNLLEALDVSINTDNDNLKNNFFIDIKMWKELF